VAWSGLTHRNEIMAEDRVLGVLIEKSDQTSPASFRRQMSPEVSVYLDVARVTAALVVFASHICSSKLTGGLFWQFGSYGRPAVDVFFVISGFVITHATHNRNRGARDYALSRAARIYSVALPAVVLTVVIDLIGRHVRPEVYSFIPPVAGGFIATVEQVTRALTFTTLSIGSDIPYWSLVYEVWYYVAFGVMLFGRGTYRWVILAALLVTCGFDISSRFPLWFLGVLVYHYSGRLRLTTASGVAITLFGWVGLAVASVGLARNMSSPYLLAWEYGIGLSFAVSIIGISQYPRVLGTKARMAAQRLASVTFSFYLFHMPIVLFLATLSPWQVATTEHRLLIIFGTPVAVVILAQFTEAKKDLWKSFFSASLGQVGLWSQRRSSAG
jgi:peptidoglycan/LPS O-acetylase OafA/YrhL